MTVLICVYLIVTNGPQLGKFVKPQQVTAMVVFRVDSSRQECFEQPDPHGNGLIKAKRK